MSRERCEMYKDIRSFVKSKKPQRARVVPVDRQKSHRPSKSARSKELTEQLMNIRCIAVYRS